MANKKISELTAETAIAINDLFAVVDVGGDETKNATLEVLIESILNQGKVSQTNLLPNAAFAVWSNSTLEDYGSEEVTNGGFDSDTTGWTAQNLASISSVAGGQSGNCLQILENGANNPFCYQALSVTVGELYKLKFYVKEGTEATYRVKIGEGIGGIEMYDSGDTEATSSWVEHVICFEATASTIYISIYQPCAASAATTFLYDTITCKQAYPGCTAADALGPDGWQKDTTLNVYREPNGANTKDGAYYALKMVVGSAGDFIQYPVPGPGSTKEFYIKYAGRSVSFGAWVKCGAGNHARLFIYDGVSSTYSSYHTGGGTYEWLEVTQSISTSANEFRVKIIGEQSSGIIYVSQPMLIFGNHIGEGHYSRPQEEWIYNESVYALNSFDVASFSTVSGWPTIDLEGQSNGRIPKNIKAILLRIQIKDSGSAANATAFYISGLAETSTALHVVGEPVDDRWSHMAGIVPCNIDGDLKYGINASGSDTLDVGITVLGVQLG